MESTSNSTSWKKTLCARTDGFYSSNYYISLSGAGKVQASLCSKNNQGLLAGYDLGREEQVGNHNVGQSRGQRPKVTPGAQMSQNLCFAYQRCCSKQFTVTHRGKKSGENNLFVPGTCPAQENQSGKEGRNHFHGTAALGHGQDSKKQRKTRQSFRICNE